MSKFELSLTSSYVANWGLSEAIREIYQNAYDSDAEDYSDYDEASQTLKIGNMTGFLSTRSLLLGATTKADDDTKIGQFGEGYKLALLVLLREGYPVTIYNKEAKEVWTPRMVKSRRYGGEMILTIDVRRGQFTSLDEPHLVFNIQGIDANHYEELCNKNLSLKDPGEVLSTDFGDVLLNPEYKGQVFVKGLYVQTFESFAYGYNLSPSYIRLDRDRTSVNGWDLSTITSKIWNRLNSELVMPLLDNKAPDVDHISWLTSYRPVEKTVEERVLTQFKTDYGENAYPVTSQSEMENIQEAYGDQVNPIIVSEAKASYLDTTKIKMLLAERDLYELVRVPLSDRFTTWYEDHVCTSITEEARDIFDELVAELKEMEDKK